MKVFSKIPCLRLGLAASLVLALIATSILTYFVFMLQPFPLWVLEEILAENGWDIIWLNFLPIVVSILFLYFLFNNIVVSAGTVGFLVILLSVLNRFKIIFRHAPLTSMDFRLGAEFMGIAHGFSSRLIYGTLFGFIFIILSIIAAAIFIRSKPMPKVFRLTGLGISLAAVVASQNILADEERFESLYVHGNNWRMENHFNSKGFLYAFIHTHLTTEISAPYSFNVATFRAELEESSRAQYPMQLGSHAQPHVFLILAEAFSEVSEAPGIQFYGGFNPLENYIRIRGDSLHGHIVVPHYGGGTADTEFDILTGISTRNFRGAPFSNTLITRSFPGLIRVLSQAGYHPQAVHPGFYWFYDRINAFNFLGFDSFKALEDFTPPPEMIAGYATEEATFDVVLERFERHLAEHPGVPLFEKVITIQNHGPYEYKHSSDFPVEFTSYPPLLPNEMNLLSNYFYGLSMVDIQLARLVDYMAASPEPVVIIYYSDHLPLLTRGILDAHVDPPNYAFGSYLPELGEQLRDFTVPFIIWSNEPARGLLSQRRASEDIRLDTPISSFYLGALILAYLGMEQADPFFYFLNNLRKQFPVQMELAYFDIGGNMFRYEDETHPDIRLYRHWSYYRLFNY